MTEERLTHWRVLQNPDYLGAWVLQPKEELVLTIKEVREEEVVSQDGKKDLCRVAHFVEKGFKPMVLNSTNCKTIAKIYKSSYIEHWRNKKIQIYATTVKAFGEEMEALRIRPAIPKTKKPELTPSHAKWNRAVEALKSKEQTIEGIEEHCFLSDENKALLIKISLGEEDA